jgi:predicted phosphodiesterase
MESMLTHIKEQINPDAIFWLGDSVPHNIDSVTKDQVVNSMKKVNDIVRDHLKSFKIYPVIGNHDTFPLDDMYFDKPNSVSGEWINKWDWMIKEE